MVHPGPISLPNRGRPVRWKALLFEVCNAVAQGDRAKRRVLSVSIGDTWADTTTSHGRLMLTVLGGLAEFERDLIRARTGEGRARAVARGQRMGRRLSSPITRSARRSSAAIRA